MRLSQFITLLLVFLNFSCEVHAEPRSLKIGFIASLTGPAQIYGQAAKNGFDLALSELNTPLIETIYEDDKFQPILTVAAFKKLVEVDKVELVITIASTPSNAVAPLAQAQKIPLLAWASDRQVSANRPYVVRSYPSGDAEGERIARFAIERGLKKFAIIISNNDYAQSWLGGVKSVVDPSSITQEDITTGELNDFKPLMLKIRKSQPQVMAVCLDPGKSGIFAKQSRELGMHIQIIGCEYFHDKQELVVSQNALLGSVFPTVTVQSDFREKYLKKFGNESILSAAAIHYDIAQLLQTIAQSEKNLPLIDQIIGAGKLNGAVGAYELRTTSLDRFFDIPLQVMEVRKDGFHRIG